MQCGVAQVPYPVSDNFNESFRVNIWTRSEGFFLGRRRLVLVNNRASTKWKKTLVSAFSSTRYLQVLLFLGLVSRGDGRSLSFSSPRCECVGIHEVPSICLHCANKDFFSFFSFRFANQKIK